MVSRMEGIKQYTLYLRSDPQMFASYKHAKVQAKQIIVTKATAQVAITTYC